MSPVEIVQIVILAACVATAVFLSVVGYKAWKGDKYLCDDCKYNDAELCHKADRPQAVDCTAYARKDEAK